MAGSIRPERTTERPVAYTMAQIIEIYEASGRSTTIATLRETALRLFPDVLEKGEPPLRICDGGFVGFIDADGKMEKPKYTISSNLCRCVGILRDGSAKEY